MAVPHFLRTFNVPLFVPLSYFIRSRFINFSTRRNKSLYTQGHHSFAGKNCLLYCRLFSSISLSVCLKLTVWNDVDVLARSSISSSHCGRLSPSCNKAIVLFCLLIFILLYSHAMAIAVSPLLFSLLGLPCRSSLLSAIFILVAIFILAAILAAIFCHAIFITAIHFIAVQPAISRLHSRLDFELPFLLWSCRRHIHFAVKDVFVATTSRRPVFFFDAFLVVVLLVIFTPSCCSYCHCSTGSNSHTVVLSKPASYSPALFSVPVKICEHAYQSIMVVYGTEKVRQLCSYSTLAGAVKVRLRYGGSTWKVRCAYG